MQAQCKQTPQEFIKNAFTPQIAVMYTPLAEKCCLKNNLDFIQLLQPFCTLTNDVSYKDPTGFTNTLRNLKLTLLDILWRPPQAAIARKLLNSSVSNASDCKNKFFQVGSYNLEIPSNTPWFESWRDTFLRVQYPSDHEFTKHFLACILVASSAENNLEEAFESLTERLNQAQSREPGKLPKWFNLNILKYYVILHDNAEGDSYIAEKAFDSMKLLHGVANCFLLKMNSRSPKTSMVEHLPDPWSQFINNTIDIKNIKCNDDNNSLMKTSLEIGQEAEEVKNNSNYHPLSPVNEDFSLSGHISDDEKPENDATTQKSHGICLTTDDVEQIKLLIYEFSRSCLMPYIEKQIHTLNDTVSNKKGVSKSLFSATKRWFSPNKPGASSVAVNNLIYSPDAPELQIRRLGDLYFMFGQYSLAFQAYHLAKRDYNTDQAWLYYAGALEMAALAAFMANDTTKKTCDYMEESITTYLNTCKMPQFATRATILSSVCLKSQNMFGEAAHQLIRMTSEESDLRSALLLEQASYCFLQSKMIRKYAFHMVLAGHRYSKAAQRKYSLKCYKQAYQVYENTGWDLASDHIHYTIGRQANNLKHFDEAVESFAKLLKGESKQTAQQQATFLKEYLTILGNKLETENRDFHVNCPILPVPSLEVNSLKILLGPSRPLSTPGKIPAVGISFHNSENQLSENKWIKLEEMLVHEAESTAPLIFKPMVTLYNRITLEKTKPVAVVNEPIQISIKLVNSLQTVLNLTNIHLLWTFQRDYKIVTSTTDTENEQFVKTHTIKALLVEGNSKKEVVLSVTPLLQGTVTINGFSYTLTSANGASGTSFIKGKQLFTKPDDNSKNSCNNFRVSSTIKTLDIDVVPPAPCLQVTFSEIHSDLLADELQKISINFQNTGSVPLKNIYMASSTPHLLCNCEFKQQSDENLNFSELCTPAAREKIIRKNHLTTVPLIGNILKPGQTVPTYIWLKAPSTKGKATIDLLIYYENVKKTSIPKYRLVRHKWNLIVQESIAVDASSQSSHHANSVEELALAMKITNLNKVHSSVLTEVMLLNVGLLSKYWTLTKDIATPKYINLHSQESAHILLKAKRSVQETSKYSSIPLNADRKSIQSMTNTFLTFAKKAEKPSLTMFDEFDTLVFKENNDGILLLQWQALVLEGTNKRMVIGQTSTSIKINRGEEDIVPIKKILSETFIDINYRNPKEEMIQTTQKQIAYNLIYSPVVKHNFIKRKICIVPIKILIHSIIENKILSVVVNTTEPSVKLPELTKSNMFCSYASSNFCWISNSTIVKTLKPLTTATVQLAAAVSGPGTFDLGAHIQVLCKYIDHPDPYVLQTYQIHPTLIIINT